MIFWQKSARKKPRQPPPMGRLKRIPCRKKWGNRNYLLSGVPSRPGVHSRSQSRNRNIRQWKKNRNTTADGKTPGRSSKNTLSTCRRHRPSQLRQSLPEGRQPPSPAVMMYQADRAQSRRRKPGRPAVRSRLPGRKQSPKNRRNLPADRPLRKQPYSIKR